MVNTKIRFKYDIKNSYFKLTHSRNIIKTVSDFVVKTFSALTEATLNQDNFEWAYLFY